MGILGGAYHAALGLIDLVSNCRYHARSGSIDFGVEDPDLAQELILRTAHIPTDELYARSETLALALLISTTGADDGRHYAAARLLTHAVGARSGSVASDEILSRFPRETIVEIQRILQSAGYYESGIDGIPGPGTVQGLTALVEDTPCSPRGISNNPNPDLCLIDEARLVRQSEWLAPYLSMPR
jgi:hypothetical protein